MKKLTIFILALFLILFFAPKIYRIFQEELHPLPQEYLETIEKYSAEYGLPIELVCSVINTESSFDPSALSHAGAVGLMQITEDTFNWLQFKSGEEYPLSMLNDPEINIKFGCFFLSLLYEEFGDYDTALAAYNAGRSRVNGWLTDERYSENGKLTLIPIEETSNYVAKVNKAKDIYKKLYFT